MAKVPSRRMPDGGPPIWFALARVLCTDAELDWEPVVRSGWDDVNFDLTGTELAPLLDVASRKDWPKSLEHAVVRFVFGRMLRIDKSARDGLVGFGTYQSRENTNAFENVVVALREFRSFLAKHGKTLPSGKMAMAKFRRSLEKPAAAVQMAVDWFAKRIHSTSGFFSFEVAYAVDSVSPASGKRGGDGDQYKSPPKVSREKNKFGLPKVAIPAIKSNFGKKSGTLRQAWLDLLDKFKKRNPAAPEPTKDRLDRYMADHLDEDFSGKDQDIIRLVHQYATEYGNAGLKTILSWDADRARKGYRS